jgi:CheY-like chemotaxis protein
MVVDDDKAIRTLVCRSLEQTGYNVLEAWTGKQALELQRTNQNDLVTTDLVMPDGEGLELIGALPMANPKLKVIAISGAFEGRANS